MNEQGWTERHRELVAEAAPPVPPFTDADLDRVWHGVAAHRRVAAGRSRRVAILAASAALVVGIGGTAAASGLLSRTGDGPSDHEELVLGGPGERLNPAGEDFAIVLAEETRDIPFPTELARDVSTRLQLEDATRDEGVPTSVSVGALRGFVANDAICSWANSWAAAVADGDPAARAAAASALQEATSWPAVTALDTEFAIRTRTITFIPREYTEDEKRMFGDLIERGGMEVDDSTRFAYLELVQQAAGGDDPEAMGDALLGHVACSPLLMTDLPSAIPAEFRAGR